MAGGEGDLARTLLLDFTWQASVLLLLGVIGSFLWIARPSRAHRWLLLGVVACFAAAPLSAIVRAANWGWLGRSGVATLVAPVSAASTLDTAGPDARPLVVIPEAVGIAMDTVRFSLAGLAWPLALVWASVSALLLARLAVSFIQGRNLVARAERYEAPAIERVLEAATRQLEIKARPELRLSSWITSPMIWCWRRRPIILLPEDVTRRANTVDWHGVFAHELAHLKRRDHLAFLAAELLICILPWNPLAWWARKRLGDLAEQSCDDWAVTCSRNAVGYAESILNLLPQAWPTPAPAALRTTRGLAMRIHAILADRIHEPRTGAAWSVAVSGVTLTLVAAIAFAQAVTPRASARVVGGPDDDWWRHWEANRQLVVADPILDVQSTAATDAYVEVHLKNAGQLHTLALKQSQITDRALVTIGSLPKLRSLVLAGTRITDEGLAPLSGLDRLELIDLSDTQISDAGLTHLAAIPTLRTVNLSRTNVTPQGIAALERALPQATIIRD